MGHKPSQASFHNNTRPQAGGSMTKKKEGPDMGANAEESGVQDTVMNEQELRDLI